MTQPLLKICHLTHAFEHRIALKDISLDITPGETFGLLGPNGSGKSTLLSILTGILHRQSGEIIFKGQTLHIPTRKFRANLGVIFQHPSLDIKLSALSNLRLTATLYGLDKNTANDRIELLLEKVGLSDRAHDGVKTFSGGMKRRLDIARALLHQPTCLIMDEPTSGLDEASFRAFWDYLMTLKSEMSLTILLSTHRPEEAAFCDRLAFLNAGRIERIGSPQEFLSTLSQKKIIQQRDAHLGDVYHQIIGTPLC